MVNDELLIVLIGFVLCLLLFYVFVYFSRLTKCGCLTISRYECWVKSRGGAIKTIKKALQDGWNTPKMQRLFLLVLILPMFFSVK